MSTDLIAQNPYRVLGLVANSNSKDKAANLSKINAFTKINRPVSFDMDLNGVLSPVVRNSDTISQATASLTLPEDRLKAAQFWFVKNTNVDEVMFNQLKANGVDKAFEISSRVNNVSSIQNSFVLSLIKGQQEQAIQYAQTLYADYASDFISLVLGDDSLSINEDEAKSYVFEQLQSLFGQEFVLQSITDKNLSNKLSKKQIREVSSRIEAQIAEIKSRDCEDVSDSLKCVEELKAVAYDLQNDLLPLVGEDSLSYKNLASSIADTGQRTIIRCYNASDSLSDDYGRLLCFYQSLQFFLSLAKDKEDYDTISKNLEFLQDRLSFLSLQRTFASDISLLKQLRDQVPTFNNLTDIHTAIQTISQISNKLIANGPRDAVNSLTDPVLFECANGIKRVVADTIEQLGVRTCSLPDALQRIAFAKSILVGCLNIPMCTELRGSISSLLSDVSEALHKIYSIHSSINAGNTGCVGAIIDLFAKLILWAFIIGGFIGLLCFFVALLLRFATKSN